VATDIETEVERSRLRHQQKKESLETEEATPDNSEEKLAELESQEQANIAERVEFALQWEVILSPWNCADIVIHQRSGCCCGRSPRPQNQVYSS
jgi:hypothetical protein